MLAFCNNYVVAERNAEKLAGGSELLGEGNVFSAWAGIARGVVVGNDDGGGAINDGIAKNLAWVRKYTIECADGDSALCDEPLTAVEREANAILLLFIANVRQAGQDIFLSAERLNILDEVSSCEFERGEEFTRSGYVDALKGKKRVDTKTIRAFSKNLLDLAREITDVGTSATTAYNNLQKFEVGKASHAFSGQFFTRPVCNRQLRHFSSSHTGIQCSR